MDLRPTLADLGWTAEQEAAFAPLRTRGLVPARVSLEHNHVYRVLTGEREWLARAAGRIRHRAAGRHALPAVGDWVAFQPGPDRRTGTIREVLPRRTWFSRLAAGRETEEQVIAANMDTVFIVSGLDRPVSGRGLERYLSLARRSGVLPAIVLNKVDLSADVASARAEAAAVALGAPVHAVSAATGTGMDELATYCRPGRTLALLGPSGAGKSSLVNALIGTRALSTRDVRAQDARGRHTSVHRQLLMRPGGGLVIDTPGMRELRLWEADEGVGSTFEDIARLAGDCRFRDCRHDAEPACAVKAAVARGEIDPARYASYLKLRQEHAVIEARREERALRTKRRKGQGKAP